MKSEINEVIKRFDSEVGPFDEHDVSSAINSFIKGKKEESIPTEWLAEAIAFDLVPGYRQKATQWGTYYGPMWVGRDEGGVVHEYPSLKSVTPEIIDYWGKRARTQNNPILRARYADLVWDLEKIAAGNAPDVAMAQIVIDSTLEIARSGNHKREFQVIKKLERALSLAISINDKNRIESVRDVVMQYEDSVAEDDKPGLWGFSFDLLFNNKKIDLSDQNRTKIIQDLKARLERLANEASKGYPGAIESAALRLAAHYRASNQTENMVRVLGVLGTAFEMASQKGSALQASFWLQHMHSLYLEYGQQAVTCPPKIVPLSNRG